MSLARYLSKLGAMLGSDGKVPTNALGAGAVLQAVYATHPNSTALGSTVDGIFRDYGQITISPKFASSKLLILHTAEYSLSNSGGYSAVSVRIHKYISGVSQGILTQKDFRGYVGGAAFHRIASDDVKFQDTSNTTQPVTLYFQASNLSGSTPSGTYDGTMNNYMHSRTVVLEIAA